MSPLQLRSRLYFIADTAALNGQPLVGCVATALAGGVGIVQYRPLTQVTREMVDEATVLVMRCRQARVPLIVHSRVDVALAATAEGVHLEATDLPVALARRLMGPQALIGVTVRSLADARQAEKQGASYLAVGPIFAVDTRTAPLGVAAVSQLAEAISLPICAMGGVNLDNIHTLKHSPAALIAVGPDLLTAGDARTAAQNLVQTLQLA